MRTWRRRMLCSLAWRIMRSICLSKKKLFNCSGLGVRWSSQVNDLRSAVVATHLIIAKWKSRKWLYSTLHNLLPIMPTLTAAAAAVLELNFTHVSFVGLCFPNVKTSLNAFQFAAKFHEIFLAALLSAVVLQSHAVRAL